jgi:CDP-4-dehydro-6-deoxyglucose reductase
LIIYEGKQYDSESGETVLDCLLRNGVDIPHSCRSGVCHTCLMRVVKGTPGGDSQKGLKPSLVEQNYFLPCSCSADKEMEVVLPDAASFRFSASVVSIDLMTSEITRLRMTRPSGFQYHPGQYLTLYDAEGTGRTYSLASLPVLDPFLELHIRIVPNGKISGWVHKGLSVGDTVSISEAIGNCFYVADQPEQSLLLVGTGTGLAPLYGIARDALHKGHQGTIKLYHGSGTLAGIYLQQELRQLSENHSNFKYTACVSRPSNSLDTSSAPDVVHGRATAVALQHNPKMPGWRAFICGEPAMVKDTSRALFLAGVSLKEIYSDPFIHSKP